jgi:hypothetical protein
MEEAMRDRDELRALRRLASTTSTTAAALDEASSYIQLLLTVQYCTSYIHAGLVGMLCRYE